VTSGDGAQVPDGVQAVEQGYMAASPGGDLDRFPQVRRGVSGAALLLV
jgi:hypothetical protein